MKKTTRLMTSLLTAVAALVVMTGCGSAAGDEDAYVALVSSITDDTYTEAQRDSLVTLGDTVCSMLDEGNSVDEVVVIMALAADTDNQIEVGAAVVQAAPRTLCPEYEDALDEYISTL